MWKILRGKGTPAFPYNVTGKPIPIVADAAFGTVAIGHGRLIPLVIVDTNDRPDIRELIEIHGKVPPGDVLSAWGSIDGDSDHIALILQFLRPIEAFLVLNFSVADRGAVVDLALAAKALHIQAGKPGDRFYKSMEAPRILIEIGGEMPESKWERLWMAALTKKFRRGGLKRAAAKRASKEHISLLRSQFKNFRVTDESPLVQMYVEP